MTGITIEPHQIRTWAESRGARPVLKTEPDDVQAPAIRFPEQDTGQEVSWDQWLASFEQGHWAFIWQDTTQDGEVSRFCKLVPRFGPSPKGDSMQTTGGMDCSTRPRSILDPQCEIPAIPMRSRVPLQLARQRLEAS